MLKVFADRQTDRQIDKQTDGQAKNYAPDLSIRGHKNFALTETYLKKDIHM
jgi:hypothetical protein